MSKRNALDLGLQKEYDEVDYHVIREHRDDTHDDTILDINLNVTSAISSGKVTSGKQLYQHRGLVWAVISVCVSTALSLVIKGLSGKVGASQGMFFRGLAQVFFSLPFLIYRKISLRLPMKIFILLILRSLIGSSNAFMNYFAFQTIPVATAKALIYTAPLFTGIFARMCLGERCSIGILFFSVLTVISVALVVQPPFMFGGGKVEMGMLSGIICAIMAAVASALTQILIRFIQKWHVDAHIIIFIYGIFATFLFGVMAVLLGEWTNPDCGLDRGLIICLVVTGFLEQISLTLALRTEAALVVSIIRTNEVFLSFLFDFVLFDIVPNAWTTVGAILVVGSVVGMTISSKREQEKHKHQETSFRDEDDALQRMITVNLEGIRVTLPQSNLLGPKQSVRLKRK